MTKRYSAAGGGCLRFSPIWEAEAVVFNPVSTEIFVLTELAAYVLQAVQAHAPATLETVVTDLQIGSPQDASDAVREGVGSILVEFERLGLVESAIP